MQWIRDRALGLTILILFILSWVGQLFSQAATWLDEVGRHQDAHTVWHAIVDADFQEAFWQATTENWQSELLQWGLVVWLTVHLVHKNSAESRDSDDRLERKVDQVLARLPESSDEQPTQVLR